MTFDHVNMKSMGTSKHVNVQVCEDTSVQACEHVTMQVYEDMNIQAYERVSM